MVVEEGNVEVVWEFIQCFGMIVIKEFVGQVGIGVYCYYVVDIENWDEFYYGFFQCGELLIEEVI